MKKRKADTLKTRPPWCYDKQCEVILSRFTKKGYEDGASSFCYGSLLTPNEFLYKKVNHKNNICHCYYTPLKGAIRFFCNEDDIWSEIQAMIGVLNRRIKTKCVRCGKENYRALISKCDDCDG